MKVWVVATDVVEGWVDVHFIGSTFFPKPSGGTERFVGGLRLNIPFDLVDVRTGEVVAERR